MYNVGRYSAVVVLHIPTKFTIWRSGEGDKYDRYTDSTEYEAIVLALVSSHCSRLHAQWSVSHGR